LVNGLSKFFGEEEVEHAGAEEIKFDDKVANITCSVNMNQNLKKSITLKTKNKLSTSNTDINTDIGTMTKEQFLDILHSSYFTQIDNWFKAEKHGTNFDITDKQLVGFSSISRFPQYIRSSKNLDFCNRYI
jgi:hypothetical protein